MFQIVILYKQVVDGVGELGLPLKVHLEAPYGFVKPAFETLHARAPALGPRVRGLGHG